MAYSIQFRTLLFDYSTLDSGQPPQQFRAVDLVGDELQADTLTFGVIGKNVVDRGYLIDANGDYVVDDNGDYIIVETGADFDTSELTTYASGEEVTIYDGSTLIARYYLEKIQRVSKYVYRFSCVSAVGLLINRIHYGGVYAGVPASTVIAEIMDTIPYTLSPDVQDENLYGWLPIASARDNLHQILFVLGASIEKDASGDIYITYLSTDSTDVPSSRTYEGGSVDYQPVVTSITVVEHGYYETADDIEAVLFDNTGDNPVTSQMVIFEEPCHGLTVTGSLTIDQSGANYAIVTGLGTLTGWKYTHTQHEYTTTLGTSGEPNEVRVDNVTLVNVANSYYVAERLKNYYLATETSMAIVNQGETPGTHITFTNPFREADSGYIRESSDLFSMILKSDLKVVTNYSPGPFGSNYDSFLIIDTAGTWTVPGTMAGQHVRVVLFGGARGGQAGFDGEDGKEWYRENWFGDPARGGAAGAGGSGFMLTIADIDLTEASYLIAIGAGGAGGASDGAAGDIGGDTTFGTLSSANGIEVTSYVNLISQDEYGGAGTDGVAGGDGGHGTNGGTLDVPLKTGADVTENGITYTGGDSYYTGASGWFSGGGGGAAAGNNGGDATTDPLIGYFHTNGGDGADASIVPAQQSDRGKGGDGGHGGGGGGLAGGSRSGGVYDDGGTPGAAGAGSAGGQGSDGFVLIFYNA